VRSKGAVLTGASVAIERATHLTGPDGVVTIAVAARPIEIQVSKDGFLPATTTIQPQPDQRIVVELEPKPAIEETVTVSATRTGKRLEDQPLRVEVLNREEIEEKLLM